MNPHAEALLNRIQQELTDLSARTMAKEQALEAIRRQGEERWQAWQAQWQQWRDKVQERARELHDAGARTVQLVEQTDSELGRLEESLQDCLAAGAGLAAAS